MLILNTNDNRQKVGRNQLHLMNETTEETAGDGSEKGVSSDKA